MVKITIITVCYNAEAYIEGTMKSVCAQDYENMEYLIVDGKSKDGTMSIINEIKKNYVMKKGLDIRTISEPDTGIYNAMNKGIMLATGDWILFMNAGDTFCSIHTIKDVFSNVMTVAGKNIDGIYGDTIRIRGSKMMEVEGHPLSEIAEGFPLPFCHQSVFVKTALLRQLMFDERYKQAGDYDLFCRAYVAGAHFVHVKIAISNYLMGGISETNNIFHWKEKIEIREKNGLQHFSEWEKIKIIGKYTMRHKIKKILPKKLIEHLVQWRELNAAKKSRHRKKD